MQKENRPTVKAKYRLKATEVEGKRLRRERSLFPVCVGCLCVCVTCVCVFFLCVWVFSVSWFGVCVCVLRVCVCVVCVCVLPVWRSLHTARPESTTGTFTSAQAFRRRARAEDCGYLCESWRRYGSRLADITEGSANTLASSCSYRLAHLRNTHTHSHTTHNTQPSTHKP